VNRWDFSLENVKSDRQRNFRQQDASQKRFWKFREVVGFGGQIIQESRCLAGQWRS